MQTQGEKENSTLSEWIRTPDLHAESPRTSVRPWTVSAALVEVPDVMCQMCWSAFRPVQKINTITVTADTLRHVRPGIVLQQKDPGHTAACAHRGSEDLSCYNGSISLFSPGVSDLWLLQLQFG